MLGQEGHQIAQQFGHVEWQGGTVPVSIASRAKKKMIDVMIRARVDRLEDLLCKHTHSLNVTITVKIPTIARSRTEGRSR